MVEKAKGVLALGRDVEPITRHRALDSLADLRKLCRDEVDEGIDHESVDRAFLSGTVKGTTGRCFATDRPGGSDAAFRVSHTNAPSASSYRADASAIAGPK